MNNCLAYRLAHACWITCDEKEIEKCKVKLTKITDLCLDQIFCGIRSSSFNNFIRSESERNLKRNGFIVREIDRWNSNVDFSMWVSVVLTEKIITEKIDQKLKTLKEELIEEFLRPENNGAIQAEQKINKISKNSF